ncbi:MAG: hypothetical protein AB7F75_07840 [Planctomycetota bacterium]
MPIKTTCSCGKVFQAPDNLAGKSVKCPGCSKPLKVPGPAAVPKSAATATKPPAGPAKPSATPAKPVPAAKPAPAKSAAPAKPAPAKPMAKPASKPVAAGSVKKPAKEFDFDEPEVSVRCPKCQVNISPTDVICTGCGTNLKTGLSMKKTEKGEEEASFSEILLYGGILVGVLLGVVMIIYATFFSK